MANDLRLGPLGWLRWAWRQLTTMKVALYLLLALGLAAIPGSVFPQRSASPMKVQQYFTEHPTLAQWLDRLSLFDVYGSAWFSAIYLLLVVSLIGCIVPRTPRHIADWRTPPAAPPLTFGDADAETAEAYFAGRDALVVKRALRRLRHSQGDGWFTVEFGMLRESGNLVFHASLLGVLLSIAAGSTLGYHGQVIVREGTGFSNVIAQYDSFGSGRWFQTSAMQPFNLELTDMKVSYQASGPQAGSANDFRATVSYRSAADTTAQSAAIEVNEPLTVGNVSVFLVGHGYAPRVQVRNAAGEVVFADSVVFLPQDKNFTSTGVVKVPDMQPQLGLDAIFAPAGVITEDRGPHSLFPQLLDPAIYMSAWTGDLGLDDGVPQNIYQLKKTGLTRIGFEELKPGESWQLPAGVGSVTFVGVDEFATFNVNSDPGQGFALGFAALTIISLSVMLLVRRRQVWLLATAEGWRVVALGATAERDVARVARRLAAASRVD